MKLRLGTFISCLIVAGLLSFPFYGREPGAFAEKIRPTSDHFDGSRYFNPGVIQSPTPGQQPKRGSTGWIWHWFFGIEWPVWPEVNNRPPGPPPATRVSRSEIRVTSIGHATFLIQMDGVNVLTDPIWSDRCSPVKWAGPKRHRAPGIRFEDLPPIDVVLISHNHYDHLDLPTLERLAAPGTKRAITPLGNLDLLRSAGFPAVDVLDWWQSIDLSADVTITLVPAQHFSSRTFWDRNETLWGGFVVSGPSGNVFFSGDTGYGPHFKEIARRFSPIRLALLPIAPFRPQPSQEASQSYRLSVHMRPAEAVKAHLDLDAQISVAAHFQVFQLGPDGFDDAVNQLASALRDRGLAPDRFVAPLPGQSVKAPESPMHRLCRLTR
jgi:L-ascorbate metabolism protein UlaG (beta-lactamase superfamily)